MQVFDSVASIRAFVGQPAVRGETVLVDQRMIDSFAAISGDRQWIHTDPERAAAQSPYQGTIAHGLLTLSLLTSWYQGCFAFPQRKMALNYGFDKVRFTGPVPSGSRLVGSFQLAEVVDLGADEVRCVWQAQVHVEGVERPAMVATWLTQVRY